MGCAFKSFLAVVVVVLVIGLAVFAYKEWFDDGDNTDYGTPGSRVVDTLKFVAVISRHGNRGADPGSNYPGDPYLLNNTKYWPYGPDGLTPFGRKQMYYLGRKVRSLYNGFLPIFYNTSDIRSSSSYMDRLLMSGENFLAGLYPPTGIQVWNNKIAWQPTAIYSDSNDRTPDMYVCQKLMRSIASGFQKFYGMYLENVTDIANYVNNVTGSDLTAHSIFMVWDKLVSEDTEGYVLPEWTSKFYPEPLQTLMSIEYKMFWGGSDDGVRLLIGELYANMLETLLSVANGTLQDRKMNFYSAHDSSIIAIERIIGVADEDFKNMVYSGSGLVLELHQNGTEQPFTVKVVYLDWLDDLKATPLKMTSCGDPCKLDTLANITAKFTNVTNWKQECTAKHDEFIVPLELQSRLKKHLAKKSLLRNPIN